MITLHTVTLALGSMSVGAAVFILFLGLAGALPVVIALICATMVGGGGIGLIFTPLIDEQHTTSPCDDRARFEAILYSTKGGAS